MPFLQRHGFSTCNHDDLGSGHGDFQRISADAYTTPGLPSRPRLILRVRSAKGMRVVRHLRQTIWLAKRRASSAAEMLGRHEVSLPCSTGVVMVCGVEPFILTVGISADSKQKYGLPWKWLFMPEAHLNVVPGRPQTRHSRPVTVLELRHTALWSAYRPICCRLACVTAMRIGPLGLPQAGVKHVTKRPVRVARWPVRGRVRRGFPVGECSLRADLQGSIISTYTVPSGGQVSRL